MLQLSYGKYVLSDIISEVLRSYKAELMVKPVMVELLVDSEVHKVYMGDYMYLEKMLRNLLDSAVKHCELGVISICFAEKLDFDDVTSLYVSVRDSGTGLSVEEQDYMYERYGEVAFDVDTAKGVGTICRFSLDCVPVGDELIGNLNHLTDGFYVAASNVVEPRMTIEEKQTVDVVDTSSLPRIPDISWDYATMLSQNAEISLLTAQNFYASLDKEITDIEALYEHLNDENGMDEYRIRVHSLKGVTATFGAMQISALARLLEFAARDFDQEKINALQPILISELMRVKEDWAALGESDLAKQMCPDMHVLEAYIMEMKSAMERVDVDSADAVMEKIKQFSYGVALDETIQNLGKAVMSIDDEQALAICNSILEELWS